MQTGKRDEFSHLIGHWIDWLGILAAIRYELGDRNTFDFVEGTVPCEADPSKSPNA